jgi:hypothetical protein
LLPALLSVVSLGAAAIHFAFLEEHYREYAPFGLCFALVAWLQALWAVGIAHPRRWLLQAGMVGNGLVVAVWVVSRTWGLPVGPEAGRPHAVGWPDVAATVAEMAIVLGCVALLGSPTRARVEERNVLVGRRQVGALGVTAVAAVLVMALVTAAIPASRGHEHDHAAGAPGGSGHGSDHGGSHHVVSGSGVADSAQIYAIRAAVAPYQDVQVARAAGWEQEHPDWPETGAHFAPPADQAETQDEDEPASATGIDRADLDLAAPDYLMYSHLGRDHWALVAVAYVVDQADSPEPPTSLTGAVFHQHVWTCIVDDEELDEEDYGAISREDCRARHGQWSPGGVWMTHVWLIDNPAGVFSETNPDLV